MLKITCFFWGKDAVERVAAFLVEMDQRSTYHADAPLAFFLKSVNP
ncbi:hypothetical protein [Bradyrhizobium sp. CB2312]|nr:hypothetical protein [Bradyrhizobium sp. CB2312]WFU76604.1 hypothetical protein QA642_22650 [Bradyrhizobium sp. CB2312]